MFAARFSGLKRSKPDRKSVFGSSVVRASIFKLKKIFKKAEVTMFEMPKLVDAHLR